MTSRSAAGRTGMTPTQETSEGYAPVNVLQMYGRTHYDVFQAPELADVVASFLG